MEEPQRGSGLLVGLLLAVFAIAFQMVGVAAALPSVMATLEASAYYPWAFTTMVIGMLAATLSAGQYCDRHGPLRPMAGGLGVMLTGLVLAGMSPNVVSLLVARFLQGLGAGALSVSLYVVIAFAFPAQRRATVLAWFSFCWLLPAFLGPPAAAALVAWNWRLVFVATIPLLLVVAVLLLGPIRRLNARYHPEAEQSRIPAWGIGAVAVGPALLQFSGQGIGAWGLVVGAAGLGVLFLGMRVSLPAETLTLRRGLGPVIATRALLAGSFFAAEAFLLLGLQNVRGLSTLQAGVTLTIGSVGWSIGSWLQSRPWVRLPRDQLISLGAWLVLAAMGVLGLFFVFPQIPLWVGAVAWSFGGKGMGLMTASTAVATMALSKQHRQGRNSGALQVSEAVGNAVLTALTGAVFALLGQYDLSSFGWIFGVLIIASGLAVWVSRRIGRIHDPG